MFAVNGGAIILGRDTYRLVQRFSLRGSADVNAAASQNAQQLTGPTLVLPNVTQKQAIKLIAVAGLVSDVNQTHFLTALGASIQLSAGNQDAALRQYAPPFGGSVLLGATGLRWGMFDDEYVLGSDYTEFIPQTDVGNFTLVIFADVTNSDAAIHSVHFSLTALFELYQVDTPELPIINESQALRRGTPSRLLR